MTDKKTLWTSAGRAGLVLGGISIAYLLLSWVLSMAHLTGILAGLVSALLWIGKFSACLYLMYWFMKQYRDRNAADRGELFKFGTIVAVCSALLYAAFYLAYVLFIVPDLFSDTMAQVMDSYSSYMDSNALASLQQMEGRMPQIGFFGNLVYCSLFGIILAAIYSGSLCKDNPFRNDKTVDEQ